ncbi:DUF3219 family protein [Alkalibacillus almallahensis]|uniref:DUF3219 family protein n=1 Tax=Alkalibacillus almallahensis TaxID=1379154 RepID=UPI001421F87F|nr:DUF3219 family protein [Alkalibacillus almallahensis]NIK13159.1 hypothetical protein [Alkalibacillus almallahensis]
MQVDINDVFIDVDQCEVTQHQGKQLIKLDFQVTHEDYHDITVLFYENDFRVKIPSEGIDQHATIHRYYTSFTNLYVEGNVGDFHVELIET